MPAVRHYLFTSVSPRGTADLAEVTFFTLALALLWLVVAFLQPLAGRLNLPPTVMFAGVGVAIGVLAVLLLSSPLADRLKDVLDPVVSQPVPSSVFLYIFLPILIFQATMAIELRRLLEDLAPILLLAVVAVLVAAAVIGFSLNLLFGVPLLACLLLGAIVATTDPAAVVAIFRDIGAPARLTRLVEGESLLNDAAAIALFSWLLALLVTGRPFEAEPFVLLPAGIDFVIAFGGGLLLGVAGARLIALAFPLLRGSRAAEATLVLVAPYILYILGDQFLRVSGVVAVVTAGLVLGGLLRRRIPPGNWQHLIDMGEQVAFWASSLLFLLAALLVARQLTGFELRDGLMVLAVVVAALAARALVLFLLLPVLSATGLATRVSHPFKITIMWGGLRGAVTLALALAVTENRYLDPELKRFVAVTASGFVLYTLFVNGLTLRRLIRWLGVDRLSPVDQALRGQVVALALADVRDRVADAGERYGVAPRVAGAVSGRYAARIESATHPDGIEAVLTERDRLALALIALASQERAQIMSYHDQGALSPQAVERLSRHAERLLEGARTGGRLGYARTARLVLDFGRTFRLANAVQRYLRIERPLNRELATRFETLLALRLALAEGQHYLEARIEPLLGARIAAIVAEMLHARESATMAGLDALRLQYPDYADAREQSFLSQFALRQELAHYDTLRTEGLLGPELHENLRSGSLTEARAEQRRRLRLDLGLDTAALIGQFPLLAALPPAQQKRFRRLLRAVFVPPGAVIMRAGERGRGMYFISSGAVEIRRPGESEPVRLGRGEFMGEMALLSGKPRTADAVALGYCRLLLLDAADFETFLKVNPEIREQVESVMHVRTVENAGSDGAIDSMEGLPEPPPDAAGEAPAEAGPVHPDPPVDEVAAALPDEPSDEDGAMPASEPPPEGGPPPEGQGPSDSRRPAEPPPGDG